jgi:hypothetical protein
MLLHPIGRRETAKQYAGAESERSELACNKGRTYSFLTSNT